MAAPSKGERGVQRIVHLVELFVPGINHLVWMPGLQKLGSDWYVVSQDKFKNSR